MNFLDVPKHYFIIDPRSGKLLRSLTISGFRKSDVTHALEMAIAKDDLEAACRWSVELHASGQMDLFWDTIFTITCKYINIANPNMYLLIWSRYQKYKSFNNWVQKKYHYELRNNQEMRNLVVEIVSVITLSKKNKLLLHPPPIYDSDFHHKIIKDHCVSEDFNEIQRFVSDENDAEEIILAMNEILNVLRFNMNTSAIYWYHWLDRLTILKRKENRILKCQSRKINQIKESYWTDWVWILWNILLEQSKLTPTIEKHVRVLYNFYKHNFTSATRRHKHVIISTAILFIKYEINLQLAWDTSVIRNYSIYLQAIGNINMIYKALNETLDKANPEMVFQSILQYKMPSVQFIKYLKQFHKEYNEEAIQSKFKTRLFEGMVTYKDPIKTKQSIKATHHHIQLQQNSDTPPIDYNILKKGSKPPQSHNKEMNILEYYQQPITKSVEHTILLSEIPHTPRKKQSHPNVISMHPEHIKVIKEVDSYKEINVEHTA